MSMFPAPVGASEENEQIKSGTVNSIHKDVKQRFFPHMSEVLRIRLDVRRLVGQIRGKQYARLQTMPGEDFTYVVVRSCLRLYSVRVLSIFETLANFWICPDFHCCPLLLGSKECGRVVTSAHTLF